MKKIFLFITMLIAPLAAHATNCALSSGASQGTQQAALTAAGSGSCTGTATSHTVLYGAGSYNISSTLTLPCGVQITGPTNWPTTATITQSTPTNSIFAVAGGCTAGTSIQYLTGLGAGLLYVAPGTNSNFTIEHNATGSLPSYSGSGNNPYIVSGAIYFDGTPQTPGFVPVTSSDSNVTIEYNAFGDINSCTAVIAVTGADNGGSCAGVYVNPTQTTNWVVKYNTFYHLEEGMHINQVNFNAANNGQQIASNNGFDFEYNYMLDVHRIFLEFQVGISGSTGINVSNNIFQDQLNPFFGSLGLSTPCCQFTNIQGTANTSYPANNQNNNVFISTLGPGTPPYGIEFWGNGALGANALMQGNYGNRGSGGQGGYVWGRSSVAWNIQNNIICGPNMAPGNTYITDEGYHSVPAPTLTANTTSSTCSQLTSVTPAISPTSGTTFTTSQTVTLTDNGLTSGNGPHGNTGIWYTKDGSAPSPGGSTSQYYTAPFTITASTVVRYIGFYGTGYTPGLGPIPFPLSYPAGYGYAPSAVQQATYTKTGAGPTPSNITLSCAGGSSTVSVGASLACMAMTNYTGPTAIYSCTTPTQDPNGVVCSFNSSIPADATVSNTGIVNGVNAGSTNLTASATGFTTSSPYAISVTAVSPVLQSVAITTGSSSINIGQTLQAQATCTYNSGPPTNCSSSATWSSSNPSVAGISGSGVITGFAVGTVNLTATVASISSPNLSFAVTSTPPPATLTGATISSGSGSTVIVGQKLNLQLNCDYSDGSVTNCTTMDGHSNVGTGWASATMSDATITSGGVVTGVAAGSSVISVTVGGFTPTFTVNVTAAPVTTILGVNQQNTSGVTYPNYVNATYGVSGTHVGGYTASTGSFYLPTGTQTNGALWDILVTLAPTPTTQATAPICKGTYTTSGTASPGAWITVPLTVIGGTSACKIGTSTAYWVGVITNQAGPVPQGFYNCGGACTGGIPPSGSGTYPYYFISQVYGTYSGNGTAMQPTSSPGVGLQASQYITLTNPNPILTGGFQTSSPPGSNVTTPGSTITMVGFCSYSDGTSNQCFPIPDIYSNTVTSCTSTNTAVFTISAVGSSPPCVVSGVSGGVANVHMTLTGGVQTNIYTITDQTILTHAIPGSPRGLTR